MWGSYELYFCCSDPNLLAEIVISRSSILTYSLNSLFPISTKAVIPTPNTMIPIRELKHFLRSRKHSTSRSLILTILVTNPKSTTIQKSYILPVHVFWMHLLGSNAWLCSELYDNLDKQLEMYAGENISMNAMWCYYHYHILL